MRTHAHMRELHTKVRAGKQNNREWYDINALTILYVSAFTECGQGRNASKDMGWDC